MRSVNALIRLRGCAGWSEPSLVARLIVGFVVCWFISKCALDNTVHIHGYVKRCLQGMYSIQAIWTGFQLFSKGLIEYKLKYIKGQVGSYEAARMRRLTWVTNVRDKAFLSNPKRIDIYLIHFVSPRKHSLRVLIRSASSRRFLWVPTTCT